MRKIIGLLLLLVLIRPCSAGQLSGTMVDLTSLWHCNENTGTALNDSLGANTGSCSSTAWVSGVFGSCLYFGGAAYVTTTLTPAQLGFPVGGQSGYPFSIGLWFYQAGDNQDQNTMIGLGNPAWSNNGWYTLCVNSYSGNGYGGVPKFALWGYPYSVFISPNPTIELNRWYHVVATYDGSGNHALYVNGDLAVSGAAGTPGIDGNYPIKIGSMFTFYWNGSLDEIFTVKRCLNSSEVKRIYYESKKRHGSD
jgi:hypothetical protein